MQPSAERGEARHASASPWGAARAFFRRHKRRIARLFVLVAALVVFRELASGWPSDATLALPLAALRGDPSADDVLELTIVARDGDERDAFAHARVRLAPFAEELRHQVHLAPGRYAVLATRGSVHREGHFELPADGVVRIRWLDP